MNGWNTTLRLGSFLETKNWELLFNLHDSIHLHLPTIFFHSRDCCDGASHLFHQVLDSSSCLRSPTNTHAAVPSPDCLAGLELATFGFQLLIDSTTKTVWWPEEERPFERRWAIQQQTKGLYSSVPFHDVSPHLHKFLVCCIRSGFHCCNFVIVVVVGIVFIVLVVFVCLTHSARE